MVSYPSGYRIMFKEYICHAKLSFSDILIGSREPAGIQVSPSSTVSMEKYLLAWEGLNSFQVGCVGKPHTDGLNPAPPG